MRKPIFSSVIGGLFLVAALAGAPALRAQSITFSSMPPEITPAGVVEECETVTDDFDTEENYTLVATCTFNYAQDGSVTPPSCASVEDENGTGSCTQTFGIVPGANYSTTGLHFVDLDYDDTDCGSDPFIGEYYYDPLGYTNIVGGCGPTSCTVYPTPNPNDPYYYCAPAQEVQLGHSSAGPIQTIDISPLSPQVGGGGTITFTTNESSVSWTLPGAGSNAGSINGSGVYMAPASVPTPLDVNVTVTNNSNANDQASTVISLTAVSVTINPIGPVTLNQAGTQQFTATVTGNTNTEVTWSLQPPAAGSINMSSGLYTAPPSVTTSGGDLVIATSAADKNQTASASVDLQPVSITITPINPNSFTAYPGAQLPLSATVSGFVNPPNLVWTPAAVTSTGPLTAYYTVPAAPPITGPTQVQVTATDPLTKASASTTFIETPGVVVTGVSALAAGQTSAITIMGTGFGGGNPAVTFSNPVPSLPAPTFQVTAASSTQISGTVTIPVYPQAETVTIVVVAGGVSSQGFSANVTPVTITPAVTPSSASLLETQPQQFSVNFTCHSQNGTSCNIGQGATWQITSTPPLGTLSSSGLYNNTATGYGTSPTVLGKACANVNPAVCGTFQVLLIPIVVTVIPGSATLGANGTQQFTASLSGVTGAAGTGDVTWSLSPAAGSVSPAGASTSTTYQAPSSVASAETVTLKACSTVDSSRCNATTQIQLEPPPTVSAPTSQTVTAGGTATFTVTATGQGPFTYGWQYSNGSTYTGLVNGGRISGATGATLTISTVQASDAGSYRCLVSNSYGQGNSGPATLTVNPAPPPTVTPPANQTVALGGTATFSVTASGQGPFTYGWQYSNGSGYTGLVNGGRISGATSATLQITSVQASDAGNYRCLVSNASGQSNSGPASLTVTVPAPPTVTAPTSQTVYVGSNTTFSVTATGQGPFTYGWQYSSGSSYTGLVNGGRISGATSATLQISDTQTTDAGSYRCLVSNAGGQSNSGPATLTVNLPPPPTVTAPANDTVTAGGTATFSVTASGQGPFSYGWQYSSGSSFVTLTDGGNISGSATATLTISDAQTSNAGRYRCLVSNAGGQSNSGPATLTVNP